MTLRFEIFPADLDRTVGFYTGVLGFELVRDERGAPSAYVALRCGQVHLGAARRPPVADPRARRPPVGVELVLEVDDVDAELARVQGSGWPLHEPLQRRPWGLRDFRLLDPDGHLLRVTSRS